MKQHVRESSDQYCTASTIVFFSLHLAGFSIEASRRVSGNCDIASAARPKSSLRESDDSARLAADKRSIVADGLECRMPESDFFSLQWAHSANETTAMEFADGSDVALADIRAPADSPSVNFYERGAPAMLQVSPSIDASGVTFYAIMIRYRLVEEGMDPLQRHATEFGVLLPAMIDSAVAAMDADFFLQEKSIVNARFEEFGEVVFSIAQVETVKKFTKWLFDLVLGRSKETRESAYEDGPKRYYVVPLLDDQHSCFPVSFVDWDTVTCAINSGLHYSNSWVSLDGCYNTKVQELDDSVDALVTCRGVPYLVVSSDSFSSGDVNPCSDYHNEKYPENQDQPLLEACKLHRAISYLSQHGNSMNGFQVPKKMKLHKLPAEACILYKSLRGKLYRGALRLPSVLQIFEMTLLAAELRDKMDINISPFKILEALISRACGLGTSYESLELLGDSVLKLTAGTHVYHAHPMKDSEELGVELYKFVSNKALSACAQACNLHRYVFAKMFSPTKWLSPGLIPSEDPCKHILQLLSSRTLADVVEAILGACVVEGGLMVAMKALRWLQIPIEWPHSHTASDLKVLSGTVGLLTNADREELQRKISYHFNNEQLLLAALNFQGDGLTFRRLEFLGDAILDYLITRYLVTAFPSLSAGKLNNLKQATVNREHYSCVSVRHGLHTYLEKLCPEAEITNFATSLFEECEEGKMWNSFGISTQSSPKVLGDMMQTLAASIFIDSKLDVELVWEVYKPLLDPIATPESVTLHPINQLQTLCKEQSLSLDIQCVVLNGVIQADVVVNNERLGSFQHEERRVARRLAAMQALQHLLPDSN